MLDFFANVQSSNATGIPGGGYTYSHIEEKLVTPTHLIAISDNTSVPNIDIFDISDPGSITLASTWAGSSQYAVEDGANYKNQITVKNGYAYYGNQYQDLIVLDITDPTALAPESVIYQWDSSVNDGVFRDIVAVYAHPTRDILWSVARRSSVDTYISTIDISNPASPTIINTITAPDYNIFATCISNDGEHLFVSNASDDFWIYGIDATGQITSPTSSLAQITAGVKERIAVATSDSGDSFLIWAYGQSNAFGVVEMGADFIPDDYALGSATEFDDVDSLFPIPFGKDYTSDDIVYWYQPEDLYVMRIGSYNATSNTFTIIDQSSSDSIILPASSLSVVDGWDQYLAQARSGAINIWEWDPVAGTIVRISSLTPSTTPALSTIYQDSIVVFAVP